MTDPSSGKPFRQIGELDAREFRADDVDGCLAVFDSNVPRYFTPGERGDFRDFLSSLPGPYFVFEDRGTVVACGGHAFDEARRVADLCWGMVAQEMHGRGVGRRLTLLRIRHILDHPRVEEVRMNTSHLTAGFYEKLGFETLRVVEDGYAEGLHRCDMSLRIGEAHNRSELRRRLEEA